MSQHHLKKLGKGQVGPQERSPYHVMPISYKDSFHHHNILWRSNQSTVTKTNKCCTFFIGMRMNLIVRMPECLRFKSYKPLFQQMNDIHTIIHLFSYMLCLYCATLCTKLFISIQITIINCKHHKLFLFIIDIAFHSIHLIQCISSPITFHLLKANMIF